MIYSKLSVYFYFWFLILMVESTSTNIPIVLALGKLGEGKSTVGNMLAGSPGGYLVEDYRPSGCTQGFDSLIFGQDF